MSTYLILYLIIAAGIILLPEKRKNSRPLVSSFFLLAGFIYFISNISVIAQGGVMSIQYKWIPELGLSAEFMLDGLSMVFALLITLIGFLVFIYARAYMKDYEGTRKFYVYLTLFSGAMLGLVLSANLIQLFMFWELTSILSFLLISFMNEKEEARNASFQSLFVTGFGGLSLLAGILIIGNITGSYRLEEWISASGMIKDNALYTPALLLILVGVFTKSAQFPFHFWLPGAMQAPTPVSAYLHSATMVKAGIFLLLRLNPVLGNTVEWTTIIPVVGVITMLTGAYLSVTQTDIKAMLAYTTISALGILVLLVGIDTKLSVKAALVFLVVHAFYKASLFMLAGYIDKKCGTRNIDKLGGLIYFIPMGFIIAAITAFSMAGLPPLLGFIGKELIYEAKVQSPGLGFTILITGVLSNILMVSVSLYFLSGTFLGKYKMYLKQYGLREKSLLFGPGILALLSLVLGLYPGFLSRLIEPALSFIKVEDVAIKLKLWHGFNQVFVLSLFTVMSGFFLFIFILRKPVFLAKWRYANNSIFSINLSRVFFRLVRIITILSAKKLSFIQHGYNRYYLFTVLAITTLLLWLQIYVTRGWEIDTTVTFKPYYISALLFIIVISIIYTVVSASRLTSLLAMGVVGYGISLIYLYYSSVDLAITQIIIETLTIIMFVLVLQKLPKFSRFSKPGTRLRDASLSLLFGGVMAVLALKAIHVDLNHPISDFFTSNSYVKAYGKNVVNVILVDFRALDTLGEVTVLAIAALGVYSLIHKKYYRR